MIRKKYILLTCLSEKNLILKASLFGLRLAVLTGYIPLLIESESVDFTSEDEEITFFVLNNAVFSGAEHLVSLSYIADLTNLAKRLSDEGRVTRVIVAHS